MIKILQPYLMKLDSLYCTPTSMCSISKRSWLNWRWVSLNVYLRALKMRIGKNDFCNMYSAIIYFMSCFLLHSFLQFFYLLFVCDLI